jgi:diacylglycerol O-acyltransferase / wax synthase
MERLSPEDDYYIRLGGNETPIQIGALQIFRRPPTGRFLDLVRRRFAERLPATPFPRVLRFAPFDFDLPVWLRVASCELEHHVRPVAQPAPFENADLHRLVERLYLEPLDPRRPPFVVHVVDEVVGERSAVFLKVHHSMCDGIGFQNAMRLLLDPPPASSGAPMSPKNERAPFAPLWLLRSALRMRAEAKAEAAPSAERDAARAAYDAYRKSSTRKPVPTPKLKWPSAVSGARVYTTVNLSFSSLAEAGRALGGTLNDAYLTVVGGAVRRYLLEHDALPETTLVARVPRSRRKPEHGPFGNHLMVIYPVLGTDLADPVARFAAIRESMQQEVRRSRLREPLQSDRTTPFGPRKMGAAFAKTRASGEGVMQGNVTVSNVPGPEETLSLGECELLASYPTPILSNGLIFNVTMRRYRDTLDVGIMGDPRKTPDVGRFGEQLEESFSEVVAAAERVSPSPGASRRPLSNGQR